MVEGGEIQEGRGVQAGVDGMSKGNGGNGRSWRGDLA